MTFASLTAQLKVQSSKVSSEKSYLQLFPWIHSDLQIRRFKHRAACLLKSLKFQSSCWLERPILTMRYCVPIHLFVKGYDLASKINLAVASMADYLQ